MESTGNLPLFTEVRRPRLGLACMLSLAAKDLWHSKVSTFALVSVICFVTLPLLILASIKEGYVRRLTHVIEDE